MKGPWPPRQIAERGRLYLWPRNRSFGDSKARPVVVIAPDAATRHGRRWVVLPLSTEAQLASNPLPIPWHHRRLTGCARPVT